MTTDAAFSPELSAADLAALKADVERHTAGLLQILENTSPEYLVSCAVSMLSNRDSAARYADAEIARLRAQIAAKSDTSHEPPNVRAKRATTAGRQARAGENVPRTARPGLVACRWRSA